MRPFVEHSEEELFADWSETASAKVARCSENVVCERSSLRKFNTRSRYARQRNANVVSRSSRKW